MTAKVEIERFSLISSRPFDKMLGMLQLTNLSHKLRDLLRDLLLGGIEILFEADSDKECEDQVCESIVAFFLLPGR